MKKTIGILAHVDGGKTTFSEQLLYHVGACLLYTSLGYQWWERNLPDSYLLREIEAMMADSDRDNNYYLWEGEP